MIERCPWCGSTDLVDLELNEDPALDVMECEDCGQDFTSEETAP